MSAPCQDQDDRFRTVCWREILQSGTDPSDSTGLALEQLIDLQRATGPAPDPRRPQ
ncbi:hypothetical protein SAMN05216376_10137 [Mameliella alba]|uniref:hypothetical protein n=1 Tax=Mameliella alba TaxID=561184 RepID=UPI0008898BCA|nr:hypothetical protein [Mameliella alba]PTR42121.1 hypothetical protein LX94_00037 [Mameliella alba]GGF55252.1 hypothetical protein GCM10011319_15660 [Mameliella alba]SDB99341.1 hypothetical protein SAMN05216376_10137 [Mameliella alba]